MKQALALFQEAAALNPNLAEAHYNLGVARWKIGQFPEAAAAYRKAADLKPDYADAHYNLGIALDEIGQYPKQLSPPAKPLT